MSFLTRDEWGVPLGPKRLFILSIGTVVLYAGMLFAITSRRTRAAEATIDLTEGPTAPLAEPAVES